MRLSHKCSCLLGVMLLAGCAVVSWADDGDAAPTPTHRARSAKAIASPSQEARPVSSETPVVKHRRKAARSRAVANPSDGAEAAQGKSETLLEEGLAAFNGKDYAKALDCLGRYEKKNGSDPAVEEKILLSKYYLARAQEDEAREGLGQAEKTGPLSRLGHNIRKYNKEQPNRSAHPVLVGFSFLTPIVFGVDLGYTLKGHWNFGLGYNPLLHALDPRLKYYVKADASSFFLSVGYTRYKVHANGQNKYLMIDLSDTLDDTKRPFRFDGKFTYLALGHSFQVGSGFMEFELSGGAFHYHLEGYDKEDHVKDKTLPAGMIGWRYGWAL